MGRTRLRLDPAGYKRTVEEGYPFFFRAPQILGRYEGASYHTDPATGTTATLGGRFWQPPGTDFLLPEPRQFDPRWYADDRLDEHVLPKALWTYAAGLDVSEWKPTHRQGWGGLLPVDYPGDLWQSFFVEAGTPSLFPVDFVAMGLEVGTDLPSGMKVVGLCNEAPVGVPLGDAGYTHFTPFLQLFSYPPPADCFVLGWSNLCLLFVGSKVYFLRTPNNDKETWDLLDTFDRVNYRSGIEEERIVDWQEQTVRAEVTALMVTEVGDAHNYLVLSNGKGKAVKMRESSGVNEPVAEWMPPGAWWIAAAEGQKVQMQLQVVGYESVTTAGNRPEFFNYGGPTQGPTQEPDARPFFAMHLTTPGDYTTSVVSGQTTLTSNKSDEKFGYKLIDIDTGNLWDSQPDGSAYRGTWYLSLVPSTAPGKDGGYLTPAVYALPVLFPALLTDRVHSEKILYDTEYDRWEAESSYYQSEDAKFTVDLREDSVTTLETSGHAERFNFPIHLEENTGDEITPVWTLRVVAWVDTLDMEEVTIQAAGGGSWEKAFKIKADGILVRGNTHWIGPARILDPLNGGKVSYIFAAKKALEQAHFDVTDTAKVEIVPDTTSGDFLWLPGTTDTPEGKTDEGKEIEAWGPGATERKVPYAKRVLTDWAGRVLYSTLKGKVWSHPDLPVELAAKTEFYFPKCVLYKNHESAVAAGVPKDQVFVATRQQTLKPKANVVVIRGKKETGGALISDQQVERDKAAITNLTGVDASENFAGEEIVSVSTLKLALGKEAMKNLAKRKLRRVSRKRIVRHYDVRNMWSWEIEDKAGNATGLEAGEAFTAQDRGDYVVLHVKTREDPGGAKFTTFTAERVPQGALLGVEAGAWPGLGLEG